MSDILTPLPGHWIWADPRSETIEDAIRRAELVPQSDETLRTLLADAAARGAQMWATCVDLEGEPFEMSYEELRPPALEGVSQGDLDDVQHIVWLIGMTMERVPEPSEYVSLKSGSRGFRLASDEALVAHYWLTTPEPHRPIVLVFTSTSPWYPEFYELCDEIVAGTQWTDDRSDLEAIFAGDDDASAPA